MEIQFKCLFYLLEQHNIDVGTQETIIERVLFNILNLSCAVLCLLSYVWYAVKWD